MATYILDTNVISDLLRRNPIPTAHLRLAKQNNETLILCQPVNFEIKRGLKYKQATQQLADYEQQFRPLLQWVPLLEADWLLAEDLWASSVKRGKQLSDVDLLIVALAKRLNAIIISADQDFEAFHIIVKNWRVPFNG